MGIGGINPLAVGGNFASFGGGGPKALHSPALQQILSGLGINVSDVRQVTTQRGSSGVGPALNTVQQLSVTPERAQVLSALGFVDVSLIISVVAQDEINNIRKKLSDIQESTLDPVVKKKLLASLGIVDTGDSLLYFDGAGGMLIVQSALEEIEHSLEDGG